MDKYLSRLLTVLLALGGVGFAVSGIGSVWLAYPLGAMLVLLSPFLGQWLSERANPQAQQAKAYLQQRETIKAQKRFIHENRDKISFHYFKATFLLAGHIAAADNHISQAEWQALDNRIARLRLDKAQAQAASEYFRQGQHQQLNVGEVLDEFLFWCRYVPEMCQSLLLTQFAFVEADNNVRVAELRLISHIARRLDLQSHFHDILEGYRLQVETQAEKAAKEKVAAQQRQRDKRRYQAEKERLNKKQNPKLRRLHLAMARLGLPPQASIRQIKRAYRQQIKRHHPDALLASGYPEALLAEATRRSAEINKSYEILKKHYNFR